MEELIEAFSFDHVHKSGARFDPEKAKWFNEQYLRKQPDEKLAMVLKQDLISRLQMDSNDPRLSENYLAAAASLLRDRVQFGNEMMEKGIYLFVAPSEYDQQVIAKKWKPELRPFFKQLIQSFESNASFNNTAVDECIKSTAASLQIKPGEIMQLLRVFISGQGGGADLIGMIVLLGKTETVQRLKKAIMTIDSRQ